MKKSGSGVEAAPRLRRYVTNALPARNAAVQGRGARRKVLEGERVVEILDPREPHRHLGVDDRIDEQRARLRGGRERVGRPLQPRGVLSEDVEEDVGIDEGPDATRSVGAGERHDLVGGHGDVAAATKARRPIAARAAFGLRLSDRRSCRAGRSNSTSVLLHRCQAHRAAPFGMVTCPLLCDSHGRNRTGRTPTTILRARRVRTSSAISPVDSNCALSSQKGTQVRPAAATSRVARNFLRFPLRCELHRVSCVFTFTGFGWVSARS